jgi:iron(III) transport system substrate-binding protein
MVGIRKEGRRLLLRRRQVLGVGAAAAAAGVFKFNIIGSARAAGGEVMLYTSLNSMFSNKIIDTFNQQNKYGVTAKSFYTQARELRQRIVAENTAGRVLHDVVEFSSVPGFVELKKKGWLMQYESPEAAKYDAQYRDKDNYWCTSRSGPLAYGYNTTLISKEMKSWKDFADPAIGAGKVGGTDPRTNEGSSVWYYCTRTNPDLGLPFWQQLAENKMRFATSNGQAVTLMLSGEVPVVECSAFNIYTSKYTDGAPVNVVYPTEVVPMTITPVGIAAGSKNPDGAKVLVDWWLSKEGQTVIRDINGANSPRDDVERLPNTPSNTDIKAMVPPIDDLLAHQDEFLQEYYKLFNLQPL